MSGDLNMYYEKAKNFIYKNARPIDIARWKYLFENGSKEEVITVLMTYQNEDGGFGNALEPDYWNPNSSPVQTWVAMEIIKEINRVLREDGECYLTLGSKSSPAFNNKDFPVVDENTKIRIEDGPENGIPHFYADYDLIQELFKDNIIE